ncbi:MAG: hypothetical protein WB699_16435, partial [Bacteroidota bacterium]
PIMTPAGIGMCRQSSHRTLMPSIALSGEDNRNPGIGVEERFGWRYSVLIKMKPVRHRTCDGRAFSLV